MILTVLCLIHETFAKIFIPGYKLRYESREAANRLVAIFNNNSEALYKTEEQS